MKNKENSIPIKIESFALRIFFKQTSPELNRILIILTIWRLTVKNAQYDVSKTIQYIYWQQWYTVKWTITLLDFEVQIQKHLFITPRSRIVFFFKIDGRWRLFQTKIIIPNKSDLFDLDISYIFYIYFLTLKINI